VVKFQPLRKKKLEKSKMIATAPLTKPFLHWDQRPLETQECISLSYSNLVDQSRSAWGCYNGGMDYGMCGIKEYALMREIIIEAQKNRKDFYALDVGAGNFQWSKGLATFIDEQTDILEGVRVHIIGIRGENYSKDFKDRIVETKRCKVYSLGAFKVEEIFAQFKDLIGELGFDLENEVDLAVSRWCSRHLVDPVGTFLQIYQLLRPQTGFFLLDGFWFLLQNTSLEQDLSCDFRMTQLLLDAKIPFLTRFFNEAGSLSHFALQRRDEQPCQLPLNYLSTVKNVEHHVIASKCITRFKRELQEKDAENFFLPLRETYGCNSGKYSAQGRCMHGDRTMYQWLEKNALSYQKGTEWRPLRWEDIPLHNAVFRGNCSELEPCLKRGEDINVKGVQGKTALHWSIQLLRYDAFRYLLNQGADIELKDDQNITPLCEAVLVDTEGRFLKDLILAKVKVNNFAFSDIDPFRYAICVKKLKAVELLITAGADIEFSKEWLEDPVFDSLRQQGILPCKIIKEVQK
jgi:hypothetical protein